MHEYRNIIHRLKQGQKLRSIAKDTRFGRNKLREIKKLALSKGWLNKEAALPEELVLQELFKSNPDVNEIRSTAKPYAEEIEKWVKQGINATVIHRHLVKTYGFSGAYNSIQRFAQNIKAQSNEQQMTVPLTFIPGEAGQVDFGKGPRLYDERVQQEVDTWFFVFTLCWSRHQYAELVTKQDIETWLTCHVRAFDWFGGVVRKIIIDNPKCAITKACYNAPEVQRSYEILAQAYGFIISPCPPGEPKKKGRVESGVKYIKKNFLALKRFKNLQDANKQLKDWMLSTAGNRRHGSTFEKPLNRFNEIEKHQLKALPVTKPEIAVWKKVKLYKDCHVRFEKCRYSAPYHLYNEDLWLKVTATTVSIYHQHE